MTDPLAQEATTMTTSNRRRVPLSPTFAVLTLFLMRVEAAAQVVPLREVPGLNKPVTIRETMILVPDLLREVRRQTGVMVVASREYDNDKLTVFVREKPAHELLEHVATIVMGEWRQTRDGYMLMQTTKAQQWQEELLALEEEEEVRRAQRTVETYMKHAMRPYTELVQEARQIIAAAQASKPAQVVVTPSGETIRIEGIMEIPPEADHAALHNYLIGRLLRDFTQAQWRAFWKGQPFVAATFDFPGALRLPRESVQWARESKKLQVPLQHEQQDSDPAQLPPTEQVATQQLMLVFALDRNLGAISYHIAYLNEEGGTTSQGYTQMPFGNVDAESAFKRLHAHPCLQWWAQWHKGAGDDANREALSRKLDTAANERTPASPYVTWPFNQSVFTLADYLEWLAKHTDLHIVADAYRYPWNRFAQVPFLQEGETVAEWLKRVLRPAPQNLEGCWWRVDGDWLLVKHGRFYYLRRTELPEQVVRQLERKVAQRVPLGLNDYAAVARETTFAHRRRLVNEPMGHTIRFSVLPLIQHLPMLRLWGTLSAAQKNVVLRNGVIPLALLTRVQQDAFWRNAWESALFHPVSFGMSLVELPPVPLPAFAVSVTQSQKYAVESPNMYTTVSSWEMAQPIIEREKKSHPDAQVSVRQVSVVDCRFAWLIFPNLRLTGRLEFSPTGR
jgi:hypothetical protein